MKRVFFGLLMAVTSSLSASLQIDKFVPGLNIYVFTGGVVLKTDRAIPGRVEGDYVNFNEDCFYKYQSFRQTLPITRRVHVGTDKRHKLKSNKSNLEILFTDDNSDLRQTHTTDTVERYENQTTIEEFIFTPIGILGDAWYDLEGFRYFLDSRDETTILRDFSCKLIQGTWWSGNKQHALQFSDYSNCQERGVNYTGYNLLEHYGHFRTVDNTKMTNHAIYPVFDKHDPYRLVAVFSVCYGQKYWLYDYINSIGYFY
jgi:hypothetical protein